MNPIAKRFARAQRDSWAGRHEAALAGFAAVRQADPDWPHLALQEALALGRVDRFDEALALLPVAATSPTCLFRGFLLSRAGHAAEALDDLLELAAAEPHNRVAATAASYALLRCDQAAAALALLPPPGDNFELLSWVWLELERVEQAAAARPAAALPATALPQQVSRRTAARWLRAGSAAAMEHTNCVLRQQGLAIRWLRPLLLPLERHWPSDPLTAFLAVARSGHRFADLPFQLGAQLVESGHPAAALPYLDQAISTMADSPELYLPLMFRAAARVELRQYATAEADLAEVARLDAADGDDPVAASSGETHEFALPHWFHLRGRIRLHQGDDDAARADFEQALLGDPTVFDQRLRTWQPTSQV
ncbi:MAG: hypothetical protein IT204_13385 [Fimbriimonadaceae bacterium]|nr:hypothetical protein [Fimbriimonadaceae bacterium]